VFADELDNFLLVFEEFLDINSMKPGLFNSKKLLLEAPFLTSSRQAYQRPLAMINLETRRGIACVNNSRNLRQIQPGAKVPEIIPKTLLLESDKNRLTAPSGTE